MRTRSIDAGSSRTAGDRPLRLLFLVADTGGGHRASARAVAEQLALAGPPDQFDIHVVDPFAESSFWPATRVPGAYGPLIRAAPWVWGGLWHATNSRSAVAALRGPVGRTVLPILRDLIAKLDPAVIVSFHPLLNHAAARAARDAAHPTPVVTVITDLSNVHASWLCSEVDAVVTPSTSGLDRCRRGGIPASRCFDFGLPVGPRFVDPPQLTTAQRRSLRKRLNLDEEAFTVLFVGGGDGSGGLERRVRAVIEAGVRAQIIVICGHNEKLRRVLDHTRDSQHRPITVLGFVDTMPDWTRAADVVVTKAGPGTIAESLCCGVPVLVTWHIPGQERGNIDFVLATGTGRYVPRVHDLVDTLEELSAPDAESLAVMRGNVQHAARPDATARIAALIAAHARPVPAAAAAGT